jgi:hypothetical protein
MPSRVALTAFSLAGLALAIASCISESERGPAQFDCPPGPDPESGWPIVSQVLEQKCGTLDCHGDRSRPLRFMGRNGARLNPNTVVGSTDGTSVAELRENRASACGLEPEQMGAVMAGEAELDSLTLCRKPLLIEAHKGGRVWLEDSPGYICLTSWIAGDVDEAACEAELLLP